MKTYLKSVLEELDLMYLQQNIRSLSIYKDIIIIKRYRVITIISAIINVRTLKVFNQ